MNNNTRTYHSDGTDLFIDKYLLKIFSSSLKTKSQAFAGNLLCGAVCTNCFEKCTYFFANIKDDSRNAPKFTKKGLRYFNTILYLKPF